MLQKLRDQTQGTGFKILVGAIIVVLTLFGFGATNLFMGADPEIATVGDYELTQNSLAVETERERIRILSRMGPDFDPTSIDRAQLSGYVAQQVVNRQILYQTARQLGVQVDPDTVNQSLIEAPAYQVDGQFNEALYRQFLQTMGFTPVDFVDEYTNALSSEAVTGAVTGSALLSDWELAEIVRVLNQTRDLAYLPLTVDAYREQVSVTDEEIATRYDEEQNSFLTEFKVDAEYVRLTVDDLMDDPSITVSDDEVEKLYADERAAALKDEARDSSHILVQVGDQRSEEEAQALIEDIAARVEAGEDFAELASELSEDPGSKLQGGSLGPVGKGIFDPAYEDALWALQQAGEISPPVLSSFGYHIIRLDEIVEKEYPALASQKADLQQKVRRAKAAELFAEHARDMEDLAYDEQTSLTETANALGLSVQKVAGVTRSSEDDVLAQPAVIAALFSDEVLDGNNSATLALSESEVVVVRVADQYPPEVRALADVTDDIRESLVREKALALIEQHKQQGLARLEAGESVTEIAASLGGKWQTHATVGRTARSAQDATIPTEVRSYAFALPRPLAGEKSVGSVALADGAALVTVTRVVQGDVDATLQAEIDEIKRAVVDRSGRLDLQSFLQASEDSLGVTRPRIAAPEEV